MHFAIRGFVRITVVVVKCGRKIIYNTIMKSVLDAVEKYAVDVVLGELAVGAVKQIVACVDLSKYLFVEV